MPISTSVLKSWFTRPLNKPTHLSQQHFHQAKQAYARGDYVQAINHCDQLLVRMGKRDDLLNLKALSCLALGQMENAEEAIRLALKINPRMAGMHLNAGRIYHGLSNNKLVRRHAREALQLSPREPAVLYQAALLYRDCGDHEQALRVIDRCLAIQPDLSHGWQLKGSILTDTGDFEAAQAALEKSVALPPGNVRALSVLTKIRRDSLADTQTVALLERIRTGAVSVSDRGTATFALADMYRREERYESAFELYREANKTMASIQPFDIKAWEQRVERTFQATAVAEGDVPQSGTSGSNLVFIIGMPRSGTSLCEQVLSAHPDVLGCGELSTMQNIESSLERRGIDPYSLNQEQSRQSKELEQAASSYMSALPAEHQKYQRVTDKAPMNFERIGFINQVFPGARFIYCTRDPLDTIVSCFIQNFQAGLNFAFSLEQITRVYIAHVRLMQHWQGLLPQKIHTVNYESLVADLDTAAHTLASFLQLEFNPAMLNPHQQQRAVTTASNLQVRKPVYTSSIGNWRKYQPQLQTVVDLLQDHSA